MLEKDTRVSPSLLLIVIVLISFAAQFRFITMSELQFLATDWIQDDSFYYFQPAWLFKDTGYFTFDGESKTYGYQPLWMMLLTASAFLREVIPDLDKFLFVRIVLLIQSCIYCATGILLFKLTQSWNRGLLSLTVPLLWLLNPGLISIYLTGKENTLNAFILTAVLIFLIRSLQSRNDNRNSLVFGILLGTLVLTRVNYLVTLPVFLMVYLTFSQNALKNKLKALGLITLAAAIVVAPWFLYALNEYGTIMPNSGKSKFIGAFAALIYYIHTILPNLSLENLGMLLSEKERVFLDYPDKLYLPSVRQFLNYVLLFTPSLVFSSWTENFLTSIPARISDFYRLFFTASILGISLRVLITKYRVTNDILPNTNQDSLRHRAPIVTLLILVIINSSLNAALLPAYLRYATWYAVPETIFFLLIFFVAINYLVVTKQTTSIRLSSLILLILLFSYPTYQLFVKLTPGKLADIRSQFLPGAWRTTEWINNNLEPGTRVGSWSSGLLGYFSEEVTVINLDGLANSPDYVDKVMYDYIASVRGINDELFSSEVLLDYILRESIEYLVDADFDANLGENMYFATVPREQYDVIWKDTRLINWGEVEGPRRWAIIRLYIDAAE